MSAPAVAPQELSILLFETLSLTGLKLMHYVRLASE